MKYPCLLLIFAVSAIDIAANETNDTVQEDIFALDEFVVTGTRAPRLLKESPVQTHVITSKDIERSDATDIQDLLQQVMPGIEFSYAMNQQTHMNFGSFGGQSVLFLVDGERLSGETMDDVDFSRIDMSNVDHVEIVRGASSALYGSNAGGGVINIITKKPETHWHGDAGFRAGKHNDRRYNFGLTYKGNRISNSLSAMASRIDSYDVHSLPGAESRVFSTVYGHKTLNIHEQLQWLPADNLKLTGRAGFYMRELPRDPEAPERYRAYSGGVRGEWDITATDRIEISYAFDQYDKSQWRRNSGLDIRSYSDVLNSVRTFYTHNFRRGDVLALGCDYSHEYLLNQKLAGETYAQNSFDIFAQYDWRISDAIEIVGALRYDFFSEGRLSRVTPKLSLKYAVIPGLNLRAAWGMGFRAPTLKERYYEFDMAGIWIVKGNPDLKPEQTNNFNISAEYTYRSYNFTVTGFYNHVKDRIANGLPYSDPADPDQLYLDYINLPNYSAAGCEISARAAWNCGLMANISYSYTHERVIKDSAGNRFNNQYMPARPHSLTAGVDWSREFKKGFRFNAGLTGRFLSSVENSEYCDYYDISKGTVSVVYPAYTLWKLTLSQLFMDKIKVTLALDNIFNYKPTYYYLNAPLTDGISLLAGVSITF